MPILSAAHLKPLVAGSLRRWPESVVDQLFN
jgi:hypothetical protein